MSVKIRLRRMGARNQPSYRVVVADSRSPRDGRFIEILGYYNPRRHDSSGQPELYVDPERAMYWLDQGAQPTETARSILRRAQVLRLRQDKRRGIDISAEVANLYAQHKARSTGKSVDAVLAAERGSTANDAADETGSDAVTADTEVADSEPATPPEADGGATEDEAVEA